MSRPKAAVQLVPKLLRLTAETWAAIDRARGDKSRNQWIAEHFTGHFAPTVIGVDRGRPGGDSSVRVTMQRTPDGSTKVTKVEVLPKVAQPTAHLAMVQFGASRQQPGARLKKGK